MKLELKHLAPYLPYGLKTNQGIITSIMDFDFDDSDVEVKITDNMLTRVSVLLSEIKPFLYPLYYFEDSDSELFRSLKCSDVSIELNLVDFANKRISINSLYYATYEFCLSRHIDVFGLIDQGLALPLI